MKLEVLLHSLIGVLLAALGFVLSGVMSQPEVRVGDRAPKFAIVTEDGKTLSRDQFGGKLLVLNFWATWCPPCVAEMPSLNEFHRQLHPSGVVVLAVSVDKNQRAMREFVERFGLEFAIGHDAEAQLPAAFGTFKYPETYIIDAQGRVLEKLIAEQDWADPRLIARIKRYL
jgi:cytochrome c biogenesis protein CcmG/thiol:disulfide interchange protein DsbE